MRIALGADHAGFALKQYLAQRLRAAGHDVEDLGPDSDDRVDYPLYGTKVAQAVVSGVAERGVAICGSGIGISIAANRVQGARAALCTSVEMAQLSRQHNDANILVLGARLTDEAHADAMLDAFLNTDFEGGRHQTRVEQLG